MTTHPLELSDTNAIFLEDQRFNSKNIYGCVLTLSTLEEFSEGDLRSDLLRFTEFQADIYQLELYGEPFKFSIFSFEILYRYLYELIPAQEYEKLSNTLSTLSRGDAESVESIFNNILRPLYIRFWNSWLSDYSSTRYEICHLNSTPIIVAIVELSEENNYPTFCFSFFNKGFENAPTIYNLKTICDAYITNSFRNFCNSALTITGNSLDSTFLSAFFGAVLSSQQIHKKLIPNRLLIFNYLPRVGIIRFSDSIELSPIKFTKPTGGFIFSIPFMKDIEKKLSAIYPGLINTIFYDTNPPEKIDATTSLIKYY